MSHSTPPSQPTNHISEELLARAAEAIVVLAEQAPSHALETQGPWRIHDREVARLMELEPGLLGAETWRALVSLLPGSGLFQQEVTEAFVWCGERRPITRTSLVEAMTCHFIPPTTCAGFSLYCGVHPGALLGEIRRHHRFDEPPGKNLIIIEEAVARVLLALRTMGQGALISTTELCAILEQARSEGRVGEFEISYSERDVMSFALEDVMARWLAPSGVLAHSPCGSILVDIEPLDVKLGFASGKSLADYQALFTALRV